MAIRPKTGAVKPPSAGLSYGGVDLTSPAPVKLPKFTTDPNSIASAVQSGTDQANAANQVRYNQGLGVLSGGANSAQNYITQAITNSDKVGGQARERVGMDLANAQGRTAQSAVSRGIGNTTILDSLQRGNTKDAEFANQGIDEQMANRKSALNLQQANQANQGAGSIAGFIANRNDIAPDLSTYGNFARQAAASTAGAKQTGTTINAPASYTQGIGGGGSGIHMPSTSTSGGGGGGSYFSNAGGAGGGAIGGNSGGLYSGPSGAGGGSIASAIGAGGGDGSFSPYMDSQGYGKGAISIGKTSNVNPLPDGPPAFTPFNGDPNQPTQTAQPKPYAGQTKSWMEMSGLSQSVIQNFINGGGKITG